MGPTPYETGRLDQVDEEEIEVVDEYSADDYSTGDVEIERKREEVEATRAEMSETIEAIKERLNPTLLVEQAKETVREATVGRAQEAVSNAMDTAKEAVRDVRDNAREAVRDVRENAREAGYTLKESIRENPWPMVLIGVGIGWLFMNARRHEEHAHFETRRYRYDGEDVYGYQPAYEGEALVPADYDVHETGRGRIGETVGNVREKVTDIADNVREKVTDIAGNVREKAGEVVDRVQHRASRMKDRVQDGAGRVKDRVQDRTGRMVERVQEGAGEAANEAQYQALKAQYRVQEAMTENPFAVGAVALALGAAVGMMIPETEYERRAMGETRDRLMHQVQEKAQDVKEKVQTVAQETLGAAKEAAKETFDAAKETAQREMREQGLAA